MKILIACEFSGIVRDAFIAKGHDAISCDLLPTERPGPHYQGDVFDIIDGRGIYSFDMIIAHPPYTRLASAGARWFKDKQREQLEAIKFFLKFTKTRLRWCVENPVGIMSTQYRKPDQIIQPWQYGHGETKSTCLWLNGLPLLQPTNIVNGREARIHKMPPSPDRWKERSRTFTGIAEAMADQWG